MIKAVFKSLSIIAVLMIATLSFSTAWAGSLGQNDLNSLMEVQKYDRAIHILVMLLAGFGFLMVFVRKYGRSSLTATYLIVSITIPVYLLIKYSGIFGYCDIEIDRLILAEFAAASLLIAAGAVLGRLKMHHYILLGIIFTPCYMFNEWILLNGGLGLIPAGKFVDTGGSIVIHAFGAIFGIAAALSMTSKKEFDVSIESDETSDKFSMVGSILLWIFWPSFCAALVPASLIPFTVINVILALSGSTLATYFSSVLLRRKISIADIANASLAGGVAIGATCDSANHFVAIIIGLVAGILSTCGYALFQKKFQEKLRMVDTCGVGNLHGMPGLFGGLVSVVIISGLDIRSELIGIGMMILIAFLSGLLSGKALSLFGKRITPYVDSEEFLEAL